MSELINLAASGTGLVVETGPGLPRVVHWGADLGPVDDDFVLAGTPGVPPSSVDTPIRLTLLPNPQHTGGVEVQFALLHRRRSRCRR